MNVRPAHLKPAHPASLSPASAKSVEQLFE